ncbi:DUF3240 family protein [Roseateles sp. BYS87W]|uniref:DUF3240 family protein n=1 Tax=Pelomonas baiyunensis TaxID=3299026 RepID=A0ABW7H1R8_9BURK
MNDCCLHLLCPRALEERTIDLLLARAEAGVFTSAPGQAHGFAHGRLSAAEQVSGCSEACLIQLVLPQAQLPGLMAELQQALRGGGVRHWVTLVVHHGEFA